MPGKKDLYVGKSLGDLNKQAELPADIGKKGPTVLVKSADTVYKNALESDLLGDEEMAYVLYMKYLDLYKATCKTADYKKQAEYYNSRFGMANINKALTEAERLSANLRERYNLRDAQQAAAKLSSISSSLPDAPTVHPAEGEDGGPLLPWQNGGSAASANGGGSTAAARAALTSQPPPAAPTSSSASPAAVVGGGAGKVAASAGGSDAPPALLITCECLYSLLYGDDVSEGVLVMDMRSPADYNESHIRHQSCLNVPSEAVPLGCTVQKIEPALPADSVPLWRTRGGCGHIVLLDAGSTGPACLAVQSPLTSLKNAVFKYDQKVVVQSEPLVLDGGYARWLRFYPQHTTNATAAAAAAVARSSAAGNATATGVSAFRPKPVTIEYPDLDDGPKPPSSIGSSGGGRGGDEPSANESGDSLQRPTLPVGSAAAVPIFDRSKKPVAAPRGPASAAASAPAPAAAVDGFAAGLALPTAAAFVASVRPPKGAQVPPAAAAGAAAAAGVQAPPATATVAPTPSFDRGNKPKPSPDGPGASGGATPGSGGVVTSQPPAAAAAVSDRGRPKIKQGGVEPAPLAAIDRLQDEEASLERLLQRKAQESQAVAGLLRKTRQLDAEKVRLEEEVAARRRQLLQEFDSDAASAAKNDAEDEREEDEWARRTEAKRALRAAEERLHVTEAQAREAAAASAAAALAAATSTTPEEPAQSGPGTAGQLTSSPGGDVTREDAAAKAAEAGRTLAQTTGAQEAGSREVAAADVRRAANANAAAAEGEARPPSEPRQTSESGAEVEQSRARVAAERARAKEEEEQQQRISAAAAAAAAAERAAAEQRTRAAAAAESERRLAAEKARADEEKAARVAAAAERAAAEESALRLAAERARLAAEQAQAEERSRLAAAAAEAQARATAERAQAEEKARAAEEEDQRRRSEEKALAAQQQQQQRASAAATTSPVEQMGLREPPSATGRPDVPATSGGSSAGDVRQEALSDRSTTSVSMKRSRSQPNLDRVGGADGSTDGAQPRVDRALKPPAPTLPRPPPPEQPAAQHRAAAVAPPVRSRSIKALTAEHLRHFNPEYGRTPAGLTGLYNMGNTCYLNSVLQCLSSTAPVTAFFTNDEYANYINEKNRDGSGGTVASEFALLLKVLWDGNYRCITPKQFKAVVGRLRPRFAGFQQQDCQELLVFLLDALHEDLNTAAAAGVRLPPPSQQDAALDGQRSDEHAARAAWDDHGLRNRSIVTQLFQGQVRGTVTCSRCGWRSRKFDVFQYLALEIPSNVNRCSLQDCLRMYLGNEKIDGFKCEKCKHLVTATKKTDIWCLPPILIVFFKRFKNGFYADEFSKVGTAIDFPLDSLDMGAVAAVSSPASTSRSYTLFAVANHYGTMNSGHYTAFCKNPVSESWYKFNDETVSSVSPSEVKGSAAYVLFYANIHMKLTV